MSNTTNPTPAVSTACAAAYSGTDSKDARARPIATIDGRDYYDADALEADGYAQCDVCGEWVDASELTETEDGNACESCLGDYAQCDVCGEWVHVDELNAVRTFTADSGTYGETLYYCRCCVTSHTVRQCECCGDYYEAVNYYHHDGDSQIRLYNGEYADVCPTCLPDYYTECERCGEWVPDDEISDGVCPECYCDESDLEHYGHTRDLPFHDYKRNPAESELYIGVELETENDCNRDTARLVKDAVATCAGCARDSVVCKEDGSLDDGGCEIVTAPFTPALHLQTGFWDTVCSVPDSVSSNCGIHIHVSSAYFETEERLMLFARLFFRFGRRFRAFAGRGDTYYCHWYNASEFGIDLDADPETRFGQFRESIGHVRDSGQRYFAVNLIPRNTVEIRAFAATLDPERIREYIAVVYGNAIIANETPDAVNTIERYTFAQYKARLLEVLAEHMPDYDTSGIAARFV